MTHQNIIIIGAGLSGIGTACTLRRQCPNKSMTILERRDAIGGTWDLFKYPGIRSDSDMFSFGYKFRPWNEAKVMADGPSIKQYINDTAEEFEVKDKIQFGKSVEHMSWSSENSRWTITVTDTHTNETQQMTCDFMILCTGYYRYDRGYTPEFAGLDNFNGQIVHPQHWPDDLVYKDKKVVVIGSGATAVTIVPAMANDVSHITLLQRSPTYVISLPAEDKISAFLMKILPKRWIHRMARARNIWVHGKIYTYSRRWPQRIRNWIQKHVRKRLPKGYDMQHFTPKYAPWDQRICAVPNADLFKAISSGKASMATDHIEHFTADGIQLKSGNHLDADIVVTATGLQLQLLGGMDFDVDGETRASADLMTYKAVLIQDAPNLGIVFGYTNFPWTLKADIAAEYLCRLINHMDKHGITTATPRDLENSVVTDVSVMDSMNSGYVRRAADLLPRQGKADPWRVLNDYKADKKILLNDDIDDSILELK